MAILNVTPDTQTSKPSPLRSGMRTDSTGKPIKNIILLTLPDREFKLLRPHLEPVELPHRLILNEAGDKIHFAYFLNGGMTSLVVVTHEFLAQMLGTGRPSVSLAAGNLQRAGLIENLRGTVKILDRRELEASACECYRAIQHFSSLSLRSQKSASL